MADPALFEREVLELRALVNTLLNEHHPQMARSLDMPIDRVSDHDFFCALCSMRYPCPTVREIAQWWREARLEVVNHGYKPRSVRHG